MHKTCWRGLRSLFGWTPLVAMVLFVSIVMVSCTSIKSGEMANRGYGQGTIPADTGAGSIEPVLSQTEPLGVPSDTILKKDQSRIALVIGNSAYEHMNALANPANDADDVARMLEMVGFEVNLLVDTDLASMEASIREFIDAASDPQVETTLFFYAGHGVQYEGSNYLIPVDADIQREYELLGKAYSIDSLSKGMEGSSSSLNIIMLDACRDNPFSAVRGGSRGLSAMSFGTRESMIVFATAPGDVAEDGEGRNSPFTLALKEHIQTADVEIRQLIARVSRSVQERTGGKQVPWVNTSFTGEFFFLTGQQEFLFRQNQLQVLEGELNAIEQELAKKTEEIASVEDGEEKQRLEIEQKRILALAEAKRLEEERIQNLQREAEQRMNIQKQEQEARDKLESQMLGDSEALALQAKKRREELDRLTQQQASAQGAWGRLQTISSYEKTIVDVRASFEESIETANQEFEKLKQKQVASYRETDPQDPWETRAEFDKRVKEFEDVLIEENDRHIALIQSQRDLELNRLNAQMNAYKDESTSKEYTAGFEMTTVDVKAFNAEGKYFPVEIICNDASIPIRVEFQYRIMSNDRAEIGKEYDRIDNAQKANGLIAAIDYVIKEEYPQIWLIDVKRVRVYSLLEGSQTDPGEIITVSRSDGSGLASPEVLVRSGTINTSNDIYVTRDGMVTGVYGVLPIRSFQGPVSVYSEGVLLGKADAANSINLVVKTPQEARGKRLTFEFATKKRIVHSVDIKEGINDIYYAEIFYKVGDIGPSGGYVFYDKGSYSDGWRYLEAAPVSHEYSDKVWGGFGTAVGGTGTAIGTGMSNTEKIVARFGNAEPFQKKADYAAKVCADLVVYKDGIVYDDWFLPSKDELNQMYQNLHRKGFGGFSGTYNYYWSSSEDDDIFAWYQAFNDGRQYSGGRGNELRVRPVRAF